MKKIFLLAILGLIAFTSCKKDNFEKFTPSSGGFEVKEVTASFAGIIVGENEEFLEGVTVTIGNHTTTTDENGAFFFKNIAVPNNKAYFTASKSGYFHGSRTIFAQAGSTHQVRIKMLDNSPIGTIQNATGGVVSLPEGGQLTFEAGDVAYPNGDPYTGQVNVAAKRIDPTTANGQFEMPGDLRGKDKDDKDVTLASYGMMAVELTDNSGNLLQVAEGQTVDIEFEVPSSLLSTAPAEIPLWYFDETNGEWIEEGSATLSGNTYQAKVGHFSFWNWDAKFPTVYFEATFVNESGQPLVNVWIGIELPDGTYGHGFTNDTGWVGGLVMANATMKIFFAPDQSCSSFPQYVMDFTTTNLDIDLGTITVADNPPTTYTISGVLVDCDNAPISNGYVSIQGNDWYHNSNTPVNADGSFSFEYTTCETMASISISGYDYTNLLSSDSQSFDLSQGGDLGNIQVCDNMIDEFFTMNFTSYTGVDTTVTLLPPSQLGFYITNDSLTNQFDHWSVFGLEYNPFYRLEIDCKYEGIGSFDAYGTYKSSSNWISFTGTVNITSYPTMAGEYIIGTLESDGTSPVVTGSFKIKK